MALIKNGSKGEIVLHVQKLLRRLGFDPGPADGLFGDRTEDAVIDFQDSQGLYADGIVGPLMFEAIEKALATLGDELYAPEPGTSPPLPFVRFDADPYGDGYDRFHLRADVANKKDVLL